MTRRGAYWVGIKLIQHLGVRAALLPWISSDKDAELSGLRSGLEEGVCLFREETVASGITLSRLGGVVCTLEARLRQEYGSIDASVEPHGALLLGELFLQEAL